MKAVDIFVATDKSTKERLGVRLIMQEMCTFSVAEREKAVINHLHAGLKLSRPVDRPACLLHHKMPIRLFGLEKICRQRTMPRLGRLTLGIRITEQPLLRWLIPAPCQPYDNAMHRRAAGPNERAVRESDLRACPEQEGPELRHLLALDDGVGGNERHPWPAKPNSLR